MPCYGLAEWKADRRLPNLLLRHGFDTLHRCIRPQFRSTWACCFNSKFCFPQLQGRFGVVDRHLFYPQIFFLCGFGLVYNGYFYLACTRAHAQKLEFVMVLFVVHFKYQSWQTVKLPWSVVYGDVWCEPCLIGSSAKCTCRLLALVFTYCLFVLLRS